MNRTERILLHGGYIKEDRLYDNSGALNGSLDVTELNVLPGYLKTHDGRTYYMAV
ncbi:hypothetical protein NE619_15505 [Anaerovorax odorimutans]|uniref:Uncharacterized protein n=1 Tax=Anaerovorax odorimutans TaxID=109327 RepID=A0ABT1RTF1_9FIRM|nr:hypothetical protein [Anaerovorax odorimutans]MCQ4638141.1 hypothetical protein [Anaerovorax odorimutans]